MKTGIKHIIFICLALLLAEVVSAQVVILQQGFDSTSGSQANGTWTNVSQIQNGGNGWSNSGTGNLVVEGNNSCSGWSTCNDKTGHTYGITGGAPTFKGTGTNIGYNTSTSTYFAIFDDYDASSGTYGTIFTPDFNLSGYTSCNLTFYWNNANTIHSYIQVQYWNGSTWSTGTDFAEGTGSLGWHEATMSLPSNATDVVFFLISDFEFYPIGLDQIEIYGTQSCSLTASISSHTNATPCSNSTNGHATAAGASGTTPYTYSWAPSGGTSATASNLAAGTYTCTVTDAHSCTATATVTITAPAAVTGTISSQTNVSCNGGNNGAATITASGGTSPYTYSWTSGKGTTTTASSLTAGSYTCTITDANSCTGTIVVSITQPGLLRDSISSSTNVLCHSASTGSATVGVKGGTTPYTYSWTSGGGTNATASNLPAGSYTVTVTDHNSCTTTATVTITQPSSSLRDSISSYTNESCNDEDNGSATVGVKGGTSPYTYSWTSGEGTHATASGLGAGNYTVTVTDHNGCTATASVTITQPAVFTGTYSQYNICGSGSNGAISLQITGGTLPYTYTWTPNVSTTDSAGGLSAGTYTVSVNDANGCGPLVTSPAITLTTVTAETVTVTSSNVSCYGGSNGTATASANPTHNYLWSPGGSTNASISGLSTGTYIVTSTETDGCTATATVSITQPASALSASISSSTNVSPCGNSTNGAATVSASGGTSPYTYSWTPSSGLTGANTTTAGNMKEGTYTCTVTDAHSCTTTATVTIGGPVSIRDSISSSTNVLCNGGSTGSATLGVKGGTSPYTYNWSPSGGTNATASNLAVGNYTCTVTDAHSCTGTATVTITQTSLLRDSITTSTNESCNGGTTGSATVGVKGGASPYTYSWSPSGGTHATVSNLAAGGYTVTVMDHNGCTNTANVTITQPSAIRDSISSQTNVLCNGEDNGSATVGVKGGTSPYTYSWTSGGGTHATASALSAGNYTVTVTDHNGCTSTVVATITQPAVFGGTVTQYNICGTGSTGAISLQITGGTLPYTYTWTPNVSTTDSAGGLSARSYTVSVNDANGCGPLVTSPAITITTVTAETVTITSSTNETCYGGNTGSAVASASPTHAYMWEPGGSTSSSISGLSSGSYTVTATETDGCTDQATVTITQPTAITPTMSYTNTCSGSNNGVASVSVSGGTSPYTYSWSPSGGTNATASNLAAGNYTVTVTDHNSCVQTGTVTVGTNTTPTVSISPSSASICTGSSTSLTASGATTYSWGPSTGLSPTTGATVTANPTSTITYTITGTTSGCSGTHTVVVTVNPLPTLTLTPSSATICIGGSSSLTASGASTYTWAPNTNLSATTGATVSASPTSTITYTITGTNSNGCVNTQTVTVTVNSLPTLTVTPSSATICNGSSTSLTASGASTYSWSPSAGLNVATGATVNANPTVTTTYTVSGTNSNGCVNTQSVAVTVNPLPTLTISPTEPNICNGSSTSLTASGASTYTWAPNTNLNTTTGSTVTASPTTTITYTITGTDNNGCVNTNFVTVVVLSNAPPVIEQHPGVSICLGSSTLLQIDGSQTYTWAPSTGLSPTTGNTVTANPTSTTTYTATVTHPDGCVNTSTVVVTVNPTPAATITSITNAPCGGSGLGSATVNATGGTSPYAYSWNSSPVQTNSTASLPAGTYTATVTDANGCTASASVTIMPTALPTPSVTPVPVCGSTTGDATVLVSGGTGPYTYAWSTSPVQTNITAINLTPGNYTVTATDANGCVGTATVAINSSPSAPTVTVGTLTEVSCNGGNNGSIPVTVSGGTSGYTYLWNNGETTSTATNLVAGTYSVIVTDAVGCTGTISPQTITQPNPLTLGVASSTNVGCSGGNTGSASVTANGGTSPYTYSWTPSGGTSSSSSTLGVGVYTITVTDANSCTAMVTVSITQAPTLTVNATATPVCLPATGSTNSSASGGIPPYTYSWAPSGGTNSSTSGLSAGTYTVTVTDAIGCTATAMATVNAYPAPSVSVSPSSGSIDLGQSVTFNSTGSSGTPPYTFSWQPSDGLNITGGATVVASPVSSLTYTVTVTDANSLCSGTVTVPITVTVPTVQSPTSCDTCIGGLNLIPGKTYLVSVWTKDSNAAPTDTTYIHPQLSLLFATGSGNVTLGPFSPQGRIIDGWQRIESQFTVPLTASTFNIQLSSTSGTCNFDDIRVFPFNGTLKTYVYDPITLRLMAVLDERNYATIYEYDEEGKLIRVKKETERGIMTIQESRTSMQKH